MQMIGQTETNAAVDQTWRYSLWVSSDASCSVAAETYRKPINFLENAVNVAETFLEVIFRRQRQYKLH